MIAKKGYYIRQLDSLISKRVRALGKCERCGATNCFLQPAHIISRSYKGLRWDMNNIFCFCSTCHFWAHGDPLGFSLFVEKNYPDRYRYLMLKKNEITKFTAKDYKELLGDIR